MELGARELMTIGTVLCGLAATWGMVKGQIGRLMDDLMKANKELEVIQTRLDSSEAGEAVMKHQLSILGSMLSPDNQENKAREVEGLTHRCNSLRRDVDVLMKTHNGKHPPI
tara:strand:- start:264 stop:599 length:336 start_codon:yes stop_codon:yes gene_type:complete